MIIVFDSKNCFFSHLFQVEWKTKYYGFLTLLNILRNILQIMTEVLGLYKKMCEAIEGCRTTLSSFSRWKIDCMKKKWKHRISVALCNRSTSFLQQLLGKINGLLNKKYWDDFDIIDQGHSKADVSQFGLYLGYPWTNFNQITTTMMAMWPATEMSYRLCLKI